MDKTVKHRYHLLLFQYHSGNTKSTLQNRLSWTNLHRENLLTEQRIYGQQREIRKKAKTQGNIRSAWITRHEIHQLRNHVSRENENERKKKNDLNNADVAIKGGHVGLAHNIMPSEEKSVQQSNEINENEVVKIKRDTCQCLCRKHS